ncbi:WGR domain-containing protein [Algibacter lectus]|uniref:WGR domain-containing protein n=1 Tax=Algibacter lectus TaxID=221126 RepID=UPI0005AB104D|nr:WGR domain-containing protein [Algibacter lectus]
MKIQQQKKLYFTEGKSDKVYEVDLCESGGDLFVVNFRYGRRGATLREGTKTVFPVDYEDALSIFNKLVESKEKKGYSESGSVSIPVKQNTAREDTILKYLEQAIAGTYSRDWKVSKIILRCAELNIKLASPLIARFISSNDEFEQYASIYTLCVLEDDIHVDSIYDVFKNENFSNKSGRVAVAYCLKYGNDNVKKEIQNKILNTLPSELGNHVKHPRLFYAALKDYFLKEENIDASVLYYVYLYSDIENSGREELYQFLESIPLKVNTFKSVRYIYRVANLLDDYQFLGLLSKRIGVSTPGYTSNYIYIGQQWTSVDIEKKKENPSVAFSSKTRKYFNKNTYSLVYKLSKTNIPCYLDYVVAMLVSLNDKTDRNASNVQYNYIYDSVERRYITERRIFPRYHEFTALMYVLYGNSTLLNRDNTKWFYSEDIKLEDLERAEILPEVWNSNPEKVLYVLSHAKSEEAVFFALRIIKEKKNILDSLLLDDLQRLVSHYHPKVLEVILESIKDKYKNVQPEDAIMLALLSSKNERAIELGLGWLNFYERDYFSRDKVVIGLLLTGEVKVIDYLKTLYGSIPKYNFILNLNALSGLFQSHSIYTEAYLLEVNNLIGNTTFGSLLSDVSLEEINKLASSNSVTNKLFAANLAKHNKIETFLLFKDSIDKYINSDDARLRQVGIELLSQFPDHFLLENSKKISGFCFSEYEEVRTAIQPTIERLVNLDTDFKTSLFNSLLIVLIEAEKYDGLHANCYSLLTENYKHYLNDISHEFMFKLVLSHYEYAQKLGLPLFKQHIDLNTLPVEKLVSLGNSDIFEIRKMLQDYFQLHIPKINYELEKALLIFNSSWQDIIDWACDYFERSIEEKNWTVNMLLYACDHTKNEVQAFGRKMITAHFREEKGLPLLIKLQEHPTKDMQFFVTNYLETYAKDSPDVILKLETYFKTSLFNINTHRSTKTRIYAFLEQESVKSKVVAEMTVRLINSILGTKTIKDRSNNIDVLLSIYDVFPEIEVPLLIKSN